MVMKDRKAALSPAHITGIVLMVAAAAAFFVQPILSAALLLFVCCLVRGRLFFSSNKLSGARYQQGPIRGKICGDHF